MVGESTCHSLAFTFPCLFMIACDDYKIPVGIKFANAALERELMLSHFGTDKPCSPWNLFLKIGDNSFIYSASKFLIS